MGLAMLEERLAKFAASVSLNPIATISASCESMNQSTSLPMRGSRVCQRQIICVMVQYRSIFTSPLGGLVLVISGQVVHRSMLA
mmetsp:Transcript_34499/g.83682  ORF Transcript_34499/g.83682 Transcript_34499/m.83682 type:complete len:84 (-) Transcript_34499:567-818(-)